MNKTLSWLSALMMLAVGFATGVAAVADVAVAHACKERGDPVETGCDAGNCPNDGENHVHIEDVRWWFDKKCCKSGDSSQHAIGDQEEVGCFVGPNGEACYVTREWEFESGREVRYEKYYCYDEDGDLTDAGYM